MDIKEELKKIEEKEGLSEIDILNLYNLKTKQNITRQSFNRTINNNAIKLTMFIDVLEAIGYTVEIKKKL